MIRLLGTFAKLAIAGLVVFLFVEAALLAFDGVFFGRSFYGFDPDIGFRVRAHARYGPHEANEYGFNDRDYPHERTPGVQRVVVLGDSFNWTFGPDGNYVGLLEQMLADAHPDRPVEVINAGYPQTHTGQQLEVLRKFVLPYQPDLVVLGFFVGNDFYDADPTRRRIVVGGAATDVRDGEFHRVVLGQPLVWRSRLALILEERWKELRVGEAAREQFAQPAAIDRVRGVDPPPGRKTQGKAPTSDAYLDWLRRRMDFARVGRGESFRPSEENIYRSLLAMRDLLAERGIGFVVAAYPDAVQVDPVVRKTLLERAGRKGSDYEWNRAQRLLRSFTEANGIAFVDLTEPFRDARRRGWDLYLDNDSHWNAAGNRLAAEILFDAIEPRLASVPAVE